ncbi:MAG: glycosyltransferase family 2 protein [Planctomycetota bacterium]
MKLAVVIPVYNELELLPKLLARLDATPPPPGPGGSPVERIVVLIDDGSQDGTADLVAAEGEKAGRVAAAHRINQGKGAALRTGFAAALEAGADVLIVQDGDLEYDPSDHGAVLAPILDGRADAVIGSRFIGQTHRVLYYWHYVANRMITFFSNALTNLNLSDIECCFKAFTAEAASKLDLRENRFGVEPEIVAKLARMRLPEPAEDGGAHARTRVARVYEVAVSYAGRTYAEGKKITWRDGVAALRCIVTYNLLR